MVTSVFKVASRTVMFFHAPLLAPESNFPIPENGFIHLVKTNQNNSNKIRVKVISSYLPERMAGMSLSFGGVNSTAAYFKAVCNFGLA